MKRVTAFILVVVVAACSRGGPPSKAPDEPGRPEAGTVEAGAGPRPRWDCVAFTAYEEIYVVNLDGAGLTRLTDNDTNDTSPVFSPDGTKIAYVSGDEDRTHWGVYVMNVDGSDKRRLSPPNDALDRNGAEGDCDPVFAPDGERVAAERTYKSYIRECELIFLPTSGGVEENFSTRIEEAWERERCHNNGSALPPTNIRYPAFSRDGRSIAFLAYPFGTGPRLWISNADGSGARRLTKDSASRSAFSPDGRKLAFSAWTGERDVICVINADGTCRRQLTDGDRDWFPTFSPDGKKIIYESSKRMGKKHSAFDIYIVNADGSERRALTRTTGYEGAGRFTPDGSKIVFVARPHGASEYAETGLYVMNADGSGLRRIADGGDFSLGPSLVEGRLLDSYGNWHDVDDDPEATPSGE